MQKPNDSSLPLLEILIECSKEKQTITYGEAASKLGIHHRVIRHPLHIIQNYCRIYNLPHLTILVVDRNGICGSGKTTVANIGEELIRVYNENWDGILKSFKEANGYISPKLMDRRPPQFIGDIKQPVEIRIDVEANGHALSRQYRHGVTDTSGKIEAGITKDEILDTIELSVEEITIALMQDKFDIYQDEDDYPTRGVRAGEPNRFVIRKKSTNLNIVCQLEPGDNEFTLTVITVMKKEDFKAYRGQFVLEV
jgi:hypothetical protein